MPNVENDLELEKLKGDPNIWMRLTMLSEDGKNMKSVFTDKENPFVKNSAGAMDKIQRLANEGRLFLREEGRSRHFHAVNKEGDAFKLGEQREMKMAATATDPALAVLMWMSKHYLRWIGLDGLSKWLGFNGISNWFEKKLQDRRDALEVDDRYSNEYKALSNEKKKELKALRKHEKIMKKLEKIQKEAELSEQTLNELRGQQAPTTTQQAPTTTQQAPTTTQQAPTTTQQAPTTTQQAPTTTQQAPTTTQQQPTATQTPPTTTQQQPTATQTPPATTQQQPTPPQQQAPLTQPPDIKPNENTMQPTYTGDAPVQQSPSIPNIPVPPPMQQTTQQENPGTKKEEIEQGEDIKDNKIVINGVELTDATVKQFPPQVVEAFRIIQQLIIEQEAALKANQQEKAPAQPEANPEAVDNDVYLTVNTSNEEAPEINQNQPEAVDNDVYLTVNTSNEEEREMTQQELEDMFNRVEEPEMTQQEPERTFNRVEEREMTQQELEDMFNQEPEMTQKELEDFFAGPTMDDALPNREIDAPLVHGANLEPDQVNMQQRHEDQADMNLQDRLAAEKEAMDSVRNWQDRLANTLFPAGDDSEAKEYYEMIKGDRAGVELLTGTIGAILTNREASPIQKQQVLDALLDGRPLGAEHKELIENSMAAYNGAKQRQAEGDPAELAGMLAKTIKILNKQTSTEASLSPRIAMLGRLVSNVAQMANENELALPMSKHDRRDAHGAVILSEIAEKYFDARQQLGAGEPANLKSMEDRMALRDLLMGRAVEAMIQFDVAAGQKITDTQQLMGNGLWSLENLQVYTSSSTAIRDVGQDGLKTLLENPNSSKAMMLGKRAMDEIVQFTQQDLSEAKAAVQNQRQMENQTDQPQLQNPDDEMQLQNQNGQMQRNPFGLT